MSALDMFNNVFKNIGQQGPKLLLLWSIILLWNKSYNLYYYCIGIVTDHILNSALKPIIKQPRPDIDEATFKLALKHGKRFIYRNGQPYGIFGMPSGHSNACAFSTTFVFLVLRDYKILCGFVLLSIVTMAQRVAFKHHTIAQVIVGALVGVIFGQLIYYLSQQAIKGLVKEKPDDNAPKYLNI
jgi:membrane-associated phospholipid phosphatase